MSLQRKINRQGGKRTPPIHQYGYSMHKAITSSVKPNHTRMIGPDIVTANNTDKGKPEGSCNRTACQAPLAGEMEHQFMTGSLVSGENLYYCAKCAREFDAWDRRSGDRVRITRELKPQW